MAGAFAFGRKFNFVNNTFTHQVGDSVLRTIAQLLGGHIREQDLAARLAGDEFVLVLSRTDAPTAERICQRIRRAVAGFDWASIADGLSVGISVSVAQALDDDTMESLVHRSDRAMYAAKRESADSTLA